MLKISIVGTSSIASKYARILKCCNGVSIENIYSKSLERARGFSSAHAIKGFAQWNGSFPQDDESSAVIVCTESSRHAEVAWQALEAGKHVMIEKPLDSDIEKAKALLLKSRTAGKIISVVSQRRFEPALLQMSAKIEGIRQGSPLTAQLIIRRSNGQAYYEHGNKWRLKDGAIFLEQDIHWIDVLQWFFGEPVKVFSLSRKTREFLKCADSTVAVISFNRGDTAIITGGAFYNEPAPPQFIIYGKGGSLDYQKMRCLPLLKKSAYAIAKRLGIRGAFNEEPLFMQVRDFVDAIRDNRMPVTTLENAYRALATALEVSSLEGGARGI